MREINDIALLDSTIGGAKRLQIAQFRRHIDIYFELREVDYFSAPAAGSEPQFHGLILKMRTKVGQYEMQYSEA